MDETKHYLSHKVRMTIEEIFYHDINQPILWHEVFAESLKKQGDFSHKIENLSSNGISNLHQFYHFCLKQFPIALRLFIKETMPFNPSLMGFYLSLLVYFNNCYDKKTSKTVFEMNQTELLDFFNGNTRR